MKIEIDGNDGVGKTSIVNLLSSFGIEAKDRGDLTKATEDNTIIPKKDILYFLLDAPVDICQKRLLKREASIEEKYHNVKDLILYRKMFFEVAKRFNAIIIDASDSLPNIIGNILKIIFGRTVRIGIPNGHLASHKWPIDNIFIDGIDKKSRILFQSFNNMEFYKLRPQSIPDLVANNILDFGITGTDILKNSICKDQLISIKSIKQNGAILAVVGIKDNKKVPIIVATPYRHLANELYGKEVKPFLVIEVPGSTEGMCPSLVDEVLDVVETGETIRANGLVVIKDLGSISIELIRRKLC